MIENIGRVASQLTFSVVAMGISTLLIQRTTVVHSFEQVPPAERASIRFCPDDPWRLTVKNLSFISVQGLKVAYVYRGLPATKIETDRDWTLYPNGPADRKDSGHYYSWDLGNQLAGETVNILFCFPQGLNPDDVRSVNNRSRLLVRTDFANSVDVTESATRAIVDAPLAIILIGWLASLGAVLFLFIKLFALGVRLVRRRFGARTDAAPEPSP
jgi:hypothetical protein